ncbi:MAG: hypothetical protein WCA31_04195 [Acidimicrobiales bacterium]
MATIVVAAMLGAGAIYTYLSPKSGNPKGSKVAVLSTVKYGSALVVGSGELAGFPLYEFSGDVGGTFGCGTTREKGYDFDPNGEVTMTCTGPMSDIMRGVASDDWPAFTTRSKPVAGRGVEQSLLGTVRRPGVGDQVTYGGHPLYLFDPSTAPFAPAGEDYAETVEPAGPWHGYWFLVSSKNGQPEPGRATIEVATLPDGKKAIAIEMDPNVNPLAEVVYADSHDPSGASACIDECAAAWIPVLTDGSPREKDGVDADGIGVLRLTNGETQVTYGGKPLYLYSRERIFRSATGLKSTGTAGNGSGMPGPDGSTFSTIPDSQP